MIHYALLAAALALLPAMARGVTIYRIGGEGLPPPAGAAPPANATFGGPDGKTLYITCGDKVFKRKVNMQGAYPWQPPIKLSKPRL